MNHYSKIHGTKPNQSSANAELRRRGLQRLRRFWIVAGAMALVGGVTLGDAGVSTASSASVVVADLAPFTGPDAILGPGFIAGCFAAEHEVAAAGGVLGRQIQCKSVDTRGDPADAVPATRQLFATTPNLSLVIGPTSDEASTVIPILNSQHMVVFAGTGQSEFDTSSYKYFYRLVPPDIATAYAMVAIAHNHLHARRVALAFGNDIGSQTFVKPAIAAIRKAGMKLVANETLDLSANSFRTEAEAISLSHPDVILTEALGPTDAVFLSEFESLNHGHMVSVIGTDATIDPTWYSPVAAAVGAQALAKNFYADQTATYPKGHAYAVYRTSLLAAKSQIPKVNSYLTYPQSMHYYDAVSMCALAMTEAHSTVPKNYARYILPIANGVKGAVTVTSYQQGLAMLKKGKKIHYVGPGGPTNFNKYHNNLTAFQISGYKVGGAVRVIGDVTASEIKAVTP